MNWYLEPDESQNGRSAAALYPTPGLSVYVPLPGVTAIVGLYEYQGILYAVGQVTPTTMIFYQVNADGTLRNENIQLNNTGAGVVSMAGIPVSSGGAPGGSSVVVATGGNLYAINVQPAGGATPIFQQKYFRCEYLDGFIVSLIGGNQFIVFGPNNPINYDALNIAQVSVFADNIVSMIATDRLLVFFGDKWSVPYYNSGALFPFIPVPGVLINQGCAAANSPVRADNTIFWIGGDERGGGIAFKAAGTTPQRVSTYAVETAWRSYSTIADAIAYSYQEMGHTFVV